MKQRLARARDRFVNGVLGFDVRTTVAAFQESLHMDEVWRTDRERTHHVLLDEFEYLRRRVDAQTEVLRRELDDIPGLTAKLEQARRRPEYTAAYDDREPLMSVRIAAYRKTDELIDVAIASVRAQSYERWEIVVVNDGPYEPTRRAVEALGDDRIRFIELPERGAYPEDPRSRWMVAGTPALNRAAAESRGTWIAPLDDDDQFTPDHLEKLLSVALDRRAEVAYGALIQKNLVNGDENVIYSDPPALNRFSLQGAIYLRHLDMFGYEQDAWLLDEPGDWNLTRRMLKSGVRFASTPDVVAQMNMTPYTHKVE